MNREIKEYLDFENLDLEYQCPRCDREWMACTCPIPHPAVVAERIAAERRRLLGK